VIVRSKWRQNRWLEFALSPSMRTQARAEIVEWNVDPLWPYGKEGSTNGTFIRRNAGRVIGRETVAGTGIRAVVDGSVVVRVDIPGNHTCEDDPAIVRRLFDEILENDLSVFGVP
jgi:hypothetical protein